MTVGDMRKLLEGRTDSDVIKISTQTNYQLDFHTPEPQNTTDETVEASK